MNLTIRTQRNMLTILQLTYWNRGCSVILCANKGTAHVAADGNPRCV